MAGEIQALKDAVADLKAGQDVVASGVSDAVTELHRIADLIGGATDLTEVATLAGEIKTVAEGLKGQAATLKAAVDEPDPGTLPA